MNVKMFSKYLFVLTPLILITEALGECGYKSCAETDPKKLNIHIISHSHDDVGWLKTVDGYYLDNVQHIITNVVKSLEKNPKRKFTQVETYFFNRWWSEQNNQTQALVHSLVSSGQLGFANGGYTVNDEGAAHYSEIIDQMSLGLNILDDLFGKCGRPLISWQIDPFGASKEMAALYAQMGFDGHVFNRGVFPKGEFIWRGSADLGPKSDIFTTILHNHYSAPNGFDFEYGNDITNENKRQKADIIVKLAEQWNKDYGNTNQVLMTFGDDFKYQNSEHYFENLDKLVDAVHEYYPNVNILYSNPMCYLWSVNQLNTTFENRERDYFPLWSGFFSSRPSLKRQERNANNLLQIGKQLDALVRIPENEPFLNEGRNQLGVMTHHDAITGTSPQLTVNDYISRLFSASNALNIAINRNYQKLLPKQQSNTTLITQIFCDSLNVSECHVSENNRDFTLVIYNPIGRPVSQWIRIPIPSIDNYNVFDSNGVKVNEVHSVPISQSVQQIPGRDSSAKFELVFEAKLERMGFVTYFVQKSDKLFETQNKENIVFKASKASNIEMKGKGFTLSLNQKTGNIESIKLSNDKVFPLKQSFKYYKSNQDSSYQFCSEGDVNNINPDLVQLDNIYSNGSINEVKQHWNEWLSQTIRVYEDEEYVELDWVVGPIPIGDNMGKDVITRFETNLNNNKEFYTDANGRQNVKRTRTSEQSQCGSYRNSISNNYYPIYERIFIRDIEKEMQLTVLTDRAQGGSSEADGQLELMIDRRLLTDTRTSLNETGPDGKGLVVRGKHYLFFKPINESAKLFRDLNKRLFMSPLVTFSPLTESQTEYRNKYRTSYSALNRDLPQNVHLLTLEKWKQNEILVRFEHFYETEDKSELSKPSEVDLENLFKDLTIKSVREMTLSANQLLSESHRLNWRSNDSSDQNQTNSNQLLNNQNDFKIQLNPQQIRTFILTIEDHNKRVNCSLEWETVSGTKIPTNAIIGGFDIDTNPLYICRHKQKDIDIPGKANNKLGCVVTLGGVAYSTQENFEVLIGHNYDWVPRCGGDAVPDRAFVAGHDAQESHSLLYVGRCDLHFGKVETEVIGKIQQKFYYGWGDRELSDCLNHQILVC